VWEITREYCAQLAEQLGPDERVKAVFPDAGCAAMLKAGMTVVIARHNVRHVVHWCLPCQSSNTHSQFKISRL
jgi:hypothetical protein